MEIVYDIKTEHEEENHTCEERQDEHPPYMMRAQPYIFQEIRQKVIEFAYIVLIKVLHDFLPPSQTRPLMPVFRIRKASQYVFLETDMHFRQYFFH